MQNIINGLPIAAVILLLAVGFAFLVKGADFFVEGSSSIAKKLKVPPCSGGSCQTVRRSAFADAVAALLSSHQQC